MHWQRHVIRDIFGWVDRQTGYRRFRYVFVFVPRKNGKTTFNAPIASYMMMADGEPGAQVYSAAGDKPQASIVFKSTVNMLQAQPSLWNKLRPIESEFTLIYPKKHSSFTALSRIADAKLGTNPHFVVYDELLVAKNRELYTALDTGMVSRRQPMIMMLTTAGFDRTTFCWEQYDYAKRVLNGSVQNDRWYPVIYEAEEDADWTSEEVWAAANPSWGVTINREYMEQACQKAIDTPSSQPDFKRFHLNIWTNQVNRWLDMSRWKACCKEPIEPLDGRVCYGGLDLSSTMDLSSLCLVFPNADGSYDVIWRTWTPEATMVERSRRDGVDYAEWARAGWLIPTPGERIDYRYIREEIKDIAARYKLAELAYDPWGALHLATELEEEDKITMVQCRQGYITLSAPSKELEAAVVLGAATPEQVEEYRMKFEEDQDRRVLEAQLVLEQMKADGVNTSAIKPYVRQEWKYNALRHNGDPVAGWCANNVAVIKDDADNIKPTKSKSTGRIDCIAALVTALSRAMLGGGQPKRSVYETRAPYVPD